MDEPLVGEAVVIEFEGRQLLQSFDARQPGIGDARLPKLQPVQSVEFAKVFAVIEQANAA